MHRPLGTSVARMSHAPFLLVEIETEQGITGRAHAFCYMDIALPLMRRVLDMVSDEITDQPVDPGVIGRTSRNRFTLIGAQGIIGMALSALDVACWDAGARAAGQPLASFLGATRDKIPAYNSNGLGLSDSDGLADEALELQGEGFDAVKIRLGRADPADDLKAVRSVRAALPADTPLMADYNQALSVADAISRGKALEGEGLAWIEEPVAHDDLPGAARIAAALETPIQLGENFTSPDVMASAIALKACNYAMPDLMRIGGVTGWLAAAVIADRAGIPLSSHLYPEVSVHLLAASPTAHWLEYVDWAEPFLAEKLEITNGVARPPDRPGTGVEWDEEAIAHYAID
jgi:mandelate racemase